MKQRSTMTLLAPGGKAVTGPTPAMSKLSKVSLEESLIASCLTLVDELEALRAPRLMTLVAPDWATAEPGAQVFVPTGCGFTGISASTFIESMQTWTSSQTMPTEFTDAVLGMSVPLATGVCDGSRIATCSDCVEPAGSPVPPVTGIWYWIVRVRVPGSKLTMRWLLDCGSDVTSNCAGKTSVIVKSRQGVVSDEQVATMV